MPKRSIAGQRGSVRGAPPSVYAPFADFSDGDPESIRDSIRPAIRYFSGLGILLVLVVLGTVIALLFFVFSLDENGFPD